MPGIEIKGRSKIANYRHGGRTKKFGGGRTNLLEQLGRVEAEPSNPNRRAEISRVHGELNRGYKTGGRVGKAIGGWTLKRPVQKLSEGIGGGSEKKPHSTRAGRIAAGVRKIKRGTKKWLKDKKPKKYLGRPFMKAKKEKDWADPSETVGGRRIKIKDGPELIPAKRKDDVGVGGYQEPLENRTERPLGVGGRRKEFKKGGSDKKWIQKAVDPKHKGYCTPMTKKTCTPARKALARTFKKKAKTGWG
jgi:hypothetical protein